LSPRARLSTALMILLGIYALGTAGYAVIEDLPLFDASYMAAITISTVGYSEVVELSHAGRLWTIFFILFGVGGASYALTSMVSVFVSGDIQDIYGRRKLQERIKQLSGHVILCGYGRMGALASKQLQEQNIPIVVVERDPDSCRRLADANIPYVSGDATEEETLLNAGLPNASALVAALSHDADNVYVTLTARGLCSDLTIVARAEQHSTEPKLMRAGATRVVCPQMVGATKITSVITRPHVVDLIEVASAGIELEMEEYVVEDGSPLCDQTLRDSPIRKAADAIVVAIKRRDGATIYHPAPDERMQSGDVLILIGRTGVSSRLQGLA
jgi:voltage-gated potassium channel